MFSMLCNVIVNTISKAGWIIILPPCRNSKMSDYDDNSSLTVEDLELAQKIRDLKVRY